MPLKFDGGGYRAGGNAMFDSEGNLCLRLLSRKWRRTMFYGVSDDSTKVSRWPIDELRYGWHCPTRNSS